MSPRHATILAFILLTSGFAMVGLWLDEVYGFLSYEGAFISAHALLAGRGTPPGLQNIGLVYPPLAFYLAVPFTWLYLPHPAIWMSAAFGAGLTLWFAGLIRRMSNMRPGLLWLVVLVPLQPGIWSSATTGTPTIVLLAIMPVALFLIARFALDHEALEEARASGRMSAWLNSTEYLNERVRFLWTAALALGVAGFARFDLLYGLLLLIPITPFLLSTTERGDIWKVLTLGLLLYLPLLASQFIWGYLTWVFTDDFFYSMNHPSAFFRHMNAEALLRPEVQMLKGNALNTAEYFVKVLVLGSPLFVWLLVRLKSPLVGLLFLLPFVIEAIAVYMGRSVLSRDLYSVAGLLSIMLLVFGVLYGRIQRFEATLTAVALIFATGWSWYFFSESSMKEDRIWRQIVMGETQELRRFEDERKLVSAIRKGEWPNTILMDSEPGFALIAIANKPRLFTLPYQENFVTALQNPALLVDGILMRNEQRGDGRVDTVSQRWGLLDREAHASFELEMDAGNWTFMKRKFTPAKPVPGRGVSDERAISRFGESG